MQSSGMLRLVALVRTDVSKECAASIIRVTRVGELGASSLLPLLVIPNVVPGSLILLTLIMEAIRSSETSVLTRATRRNIPQYGIPQDNLCLAKSSNRTPLKLRMIQSSHIP
jgi:hypothetical protein